MTKEDLIKKYKDKKTEFNNLYNDTSDDFKKHAKTIYQHEMERFSEIIYDLDKLNEDIVSEEGNICPKCGCNKHTKDADNGKMCINCDKWF